MRFRAYRVCSLLDLLGLIGFRASGLLGLECSLGPRVQGLGLKRLGHRVWGLRRVWGFGGTYKCTVRALMRDFSSTDVRTRVSEVLGVEDLLQLLSISVSPV